MLKEYLSEAVSLLAEAVLGKPISASAACADNPACHYLYTFHGLCDHVVLRNGQRREYTIAGDRRCIVAQDVHIAVSNIPAPLRPIL